MPVGDIYFLLKLSFVHHMTALSCSQHDNAELFSRSSISPNPIACVNSPNSVWSNVLYRIDSSVCKSLYNIANHSIGYKM